MSEEDHAAPMTGFLSTLTPEQRQEALTYTGDDTVGRFHEEDHMASRDLAHTSEAGHGALPMPSTEAERVERLAADLLDVEEFYDAPECVNLNHDWGARQIAAGRNALHSGDCTKKPWTCQRCLYVEFTAKARLMMSRGWALADGTGRAPSPSQTASQVPGTPSNPSTPSSLKEAQ